MVLSAEKALLAEGAGGGVKGGQKGNGGGEREAMVGAAVDLGRCVFVPTVNWSRGRLTLCEGCFAVHFTYCYEKGDWAGSKNHRGSKEFVIDGPHASYC